MDMIGRIRRLHSRKNKSEREISCITGLSRNTVSKWLHGEVDGPPKVRIHGVLEVATPGEPRRACSLT
jgi:transcriptional regulator with XRE-family HTH domain